MNPIRYYATLMFCLAFMAFLCLLALPLWPYIIWKHWICKRPEGISVKGYGHDKPKLVWGNMGDAK